MSYILDALKKADHERSVGEVPDLDAPHWSQRRGGPVRIWVWVVIGLLVVNGALLGVLFNRDDRSDSQPGIATQMPEPVQGMPKNAPTYPPQEQQHSTITKLQQPDSLPLKPLVRPERNAMIRPRQAVPPVEESSRESKPAAVADSMSAAPVAAKPVKASVTEIPEWNELSLEFRSGFNPPRLDVHVYDEEPSRRFILVELQRYAEGDTLDGGAKLEKIMPGSIQLYYQGTRFRIDR